MRKCQCEGVRVWGVLTNMLDNNLDPADQLQALPVIEGEAVATSNPQQKSTKDPLCPKLWLERLLLFKVLEDLNTRCTFPNGIPTEHVPATIIVRGEGGGREGGGRREGCDGLTLRNQPPTQTLVQTQSSCS